MISVRPGGDERFGRGLFGCEMLGYVPLKPAEGQFLMIFGCKYIPKESVLQLPDAENATFTADLTLQQPPGPDLQSRVLPVSSYQCPSLSASRGIQWPPITERAMKPVLRPVTVSYQSEMGTRVSVSLI